MAELLVCDDDPHIRNMLDVLLTLEGHVVTHACDGAEALDLLTSEREFDVVLLDVMMPRLSGWDVAEQLAIARPDHGIPIIFTTAKDDDQAQWFGWNLGASSYLVKPYNMGDLISEIERVLTPADA